MARSNPESIRISVIAPIVALGQSVRHLRESLLAQSSSNWELIVVGHTDVTTSVRLGRGVDARVRIVDASGTSFASAINAGLDVASGNYILISPRDSTFRSDAIELFADAFDGSSGAGVVYADEEISRSRGKAPIIVPKPDFSPERLRCQFYIGDAVAYSRELVKSLGGIREAFPGAELYDLALRASVKAVRVFHIPYVELQLPAGSDVPGVVRGAEALESTKRALAEHLVATGGGSVELVSESGIHRTHRSVVGAPLVSIIIPSRGGHGKVRGEDRCLVLDAVRSIVETSTYANFEIVVVMDRVAEGGVAAELNRVARERIRIVWWEKPFNFSAKCNFGAFHAQGEYLLFLNDDVEVISPGWIEAMLSLAQRHNAGIVGAKLYFEDDTIQHAGHLYESGEAAHIATFEPRTSSGPFGSLAVEREILGVTAACALVRRSVFDDAGGFSLLLPVNFNDVDLCLKIGLLGYQNYWTPNSELFHFESKTRIFGVRHYEIETAWARWEWKLDDLRFWPYGDRDGWHPDRVRTRS